MIFFSIDRIDAALFNYEHSLYILENSHSESKEIAQLLYTIAEAQAFKGNMDKSLECSLKASQIRYKFYQSHQMKCIASSIQTANLAIIDLNRESIQDHANIITKNDHFSNFNENNFEDENSQLDMIIPMSYDIQSILGIQAKEDIKKCSIALNCSERIFRYLKSKRDKTEFNELQKQQFLLVTRNCVCLKMRMIPRSMLMLIKSIYDQRQIDDSMQFEISPQKVKQIMIRMMALTPSVYLDELRGQFDQLSQHEDNRDLLEILKILLNFAFDDCLDSNRV